MGNKAFLLTKINIQNTLNLSGLRKAPVGIKLRIGLVLFGVLSLVGSFVGMMIGMFMLTGEALQKMNVLHLLPAVGVMGVSMLIFILSVYKANSYLFAFRDFDMLMAMPVTERDVLISKITMLYLDNLMYVLLGYAPIAVVYGVITDSGAAYYLLAVVMAFLLPVLPMALGSLIALPLAFLSARSRVMNAFMMVGSIAIVVLSVWLSNAMPRVMVSSEDAMLAVLSVKGVVGWYPPAVWLVEGLSGDWLSAALFTGANLLVGFGFLLVYARGFRSINAKMTEQFARSAYKMRTLAVSGRFLALLKREVRGYFSSYTYVLNTAMGAIMATFYVGMLLFMNPEAVAVMLEIPYAVDTMIPVTLAIMAFCAIVGTTTACSISIEGQTLWVLKSLPIRFRDVAKAKVVLSLLVSVPILVLDAAVLAVVFKFGFVQFAMIALAIALCSLMAALGGLLCNLLLPNLAWKSQVQAVKQSASVIVAMLLHMAIVVVPCVVYAVMGMPDLSYFLLGTSGYLAAVCAVMWMFLVRKGEGIFLQL